MSGRKHCAFGVGIVIICQMDISEQAGVFLYLNTKGFILQQSSSKRLRFERQATNSEIEILNNLTSLPVRIKVDEEISNYTATSFDDLMKYLKKTVK